MPPNVLLMELSIPSHIEKKKSCVAQSLINKRPVQDNVQYEYDSPHCCTKQGPFLDHQNQTPAALHCLSGRKSALVTSSPPVFPFFLSGCNGGTLH
jgi:hypothetical protein